MGLELNNPKMHALVTEPARCSKSYLNVYLSFSHTHALTQTVSPVLTFILCSESAISVAQCFKHVERQVPIEFQNNSTVFYRNYYFCQWYHFLSLSSLKPCYLPYLLDTFAIHLQLITKFHWFDFLNLLNWSLLFHSHDPFSHYLSAELS